MDDKSNNNVRDVTEITVEPPKPAPSRDGGDISLFTPKEQEELKRVEESGLTPLGATVAAQMFKLFLEGYSCAEIARLNSHLRAKDGLREGDVLYLRKRYKWDENRDSYVYNLQVQTTSRLSKVKMEILEFTMNQMAVAHKEFNEKAKRYLQTGKEEDRPDHWLNTPTAYKAMVETIQKITGEDRVSNHNIRSESKVTVESNQPITVISPELQTKMLKKLALTEGKSDKKDE